MRIDSVPPAPYFVRMGQPTPNLADALRDAIRRTGRSLYALARVAGVDRSVLSRFTRGERDIGLTIADKLCKVLNLVLVSRRAVARRATNKATPTPLGVRPPRRNPPKR